MNKKDFATKNTKRAKNYEANAGQSILDSYALKTEE